MFGSGRVRLSGQNPWPARRPVTWLSRVGSDSGFLVIIFRIDRVGLGYFLSSCENFDMCPTRCMVGRVFSSGLDGSDLVGMD
jgi:hypothetical protein